MTLDEQFDKKFTGWNAGTFDEIKKWIAQHYLPKQAVLEAIKKRPYYPPMKADDLIKILGL